jgi:hypothetical protein
MDIELRRGELRRGRKQRGALLAGSLKCDLRWRRFIASFLLIDRSTAPFSTRSRFADSRWAVTFSSKGQ